MDSLLGITLNKWRSLLKENRYSVDSPYWGRAFFLTMLSLANSYHKRKDDQLFGTELMKTEVKDPIFIIGHWRSGTTLLHYLMSKDEQFGYPTIFQVSNPHTFLVGEKLVPNQSLR